MDGVVGLRADEPKAKPVRTPSPAEVAFADSVKAAQKSLQEAKAYTVVADGNSEPPIRIEQIRQHCHRSQINAK